MTRLDAWIDGVIDRWLLGHTPPQAPAVARWDIATFEATR